jgi:hypothetical protein
MERVKKDITLEKTGKFSKYALTALEDYVIFVSGKRRVMKKQNRMEVKLYILLNLALGRGE